MLAYIFQVDVPLVGAVGAGGGGEKGQRGMQQTVRVELLQLKLSTTRAVQVQRERRVLELAGRGLGDKQENGSEKRGGGASISWKETRSCGSYR